MAEFEDVIAAFQESRRRGLKPQPRLLTSEWAEAHRIVAASSQPGRWRNKTTPHLVEIMDAGHTPGVEMVTVMVASQMAKSEAILNSLGRAVHLSPAPILLIQPTVDMARVFSKTRLAPMIASTEALSTLISPHKSRDSENTVLEKGFPNAPVSLGGANSPAGLASRPIERFYADETDRWPISAGNEGDPWWLGYQRTANFPNRFIMSTSTPTIAGASRIETLYLDGSMGRFAIPCQHCSEFFIPTWQHVVWPSGKPYKAELCCPHCGGVHSDGSRIKSIYDGAWDHEHPDRIKHRSFHTSAICSTFARLGNLADRWLKCQKSPELLQTFINTVLGEVYHEVQEIHSAEALLKHRRSIGLNNAPDWVQYCTAFADVQDDRVEAAIFGWGEDDSCAVLNYKVIDGAFTNADTRDLLVDYYFKTVIRREDGLPMKVMACGVDAGGSYTQAVLDLCFKHRRRRMFAMRGHSTATSQRTMPIWPDEASKSRTHKFRTFYQTGTYAAKVVIYAWLAEDPCRMQFAEDLPGDFYDQLTSERLKTKSIKGFPVREWILPSGKRNEALDIAVGNLALNRRLKVDVERMARINSARLEKLKGVDMEKRRKQNRVTVDLTGDSEQSVTFEEQKIRVLKRE